MDFPIENGGSFHSYVTVYQRVLPLLISTDPFRHGTRLRSPMVPAKSPGSSCDSVDPGSNRGPPKELDAEYDGEYYWLVVWNIFFPIYWESWSQLTNSYIVNTLVNTKKRLKLARFFLLNFGGPIFLAENEINFKWIWNHARKSPIKIDHWPWGWTCSNRRSCESFFCLGDPWI